MAEVKNYSGLFQVKSPGAVLALKTANDVQTVGLVGQKCRIVSVYAVVMEAIKCATTQAVVDIGTASDPDKYVDGWEPEDNALVDSILECPAAKIDAAVAKRLLDADDTIIAKVVTASAEGGAETGTLIVVLELATEGAT